jgi:hypothetical protein
MPVSRLRKSPFSGNVFSFVVAPGRGAAARFSGRHTHIPHHGVFFMLIRFMSIRTLAFVLLVGASAAFAAPPKSAPKQTPPSDQPPDSLDVDAMARAKDANGAQPADADAPADATAPAPEAPSSAPITDAPAAEPSTPEPAVPVEPSSAANNASAATTEENAPTIQAKPDVGSVEPLTEESAEKSIAAACTSRAASLLDDAAKADYSSATRDFDAKMRTALPVPKFKQQWESLAQFGKLVARGQSHLGKGEGYTLVMIPLIFEKTNLVAQIACGSDGRIAGFHVTQAPKPQF